MSALLSLQTPAIFLLGFVTMFFGTSTGGVGLILVPLFIALGLPPHTAVATTRFAVFAGDLIGLRVFDRGGKVDQRLALPILLLGIGGSIIGSFVLLWTPGPLVEKLLGAFLLVMLAFMALRKEMGMHPVTTVTPVRKGIGYVSLFFISIFGAYFSTASGLLGRTSLMTCFGQTYLQSTATRKIQAFGIGVIAVPLFAWHGIIDLPIALTITPAMILGSFFGSRYALRKGDRWVQMLFFLIVLMAGFQLLFF